MRKQTEFKTIKITKELYERLIDDRDCFQAQIGGGRWSLTDTITEFYKIMPKRNAKLLHNGKMISWEKYKGLKK